MLIIVAIVNRALLTVKKIRQQRLRPAAAVVTIGAMDTVEDFTQPIRLSSSIVLLGMKHVGKTTLGQQFATRHHLAWIDMDELIVDRARESYNIEARNAREVYIKLGKDGFQEIETAAARYLRLYSSRNQIIATGGGIADNPAALAELAAIGTSVYLQESPDILFQRIMAGGLPPFLDARDPRGSFDELFDRRDAIYRKTARIVLNLQGASIPEALQLFETAIRG